MSQWFDAGMLETITEPGSRGYLLEGFEGVPFFVVRKAGGVFAYHNRCPHTGAPLEWQPHQFLDQDNSFIQCVIHGALFRAEDGYCLHGPCATRSLEALPVQVREGRLWVDISPLTGDLD